MIKSYVLLLYSFTHSYGQIPLLLKEDVNFLNYNNQVFQWHQSNDTLYEFFCAPTGICRDEPRRHYKIHDYFVQQPFTVLRLERLDTISLTSTPYPSTRFHIIAFKDLGQNKVGFAQLQWDLTKSQLDSTI